MGRATPVVPKSGTPKTTLMDKRVSKPADKTGKQPMVYPRGKYGKK